MWDVADGRGGLEVRDRVFGGDGERGRGEGGVGGEPVEERDACVVTGDVDVGGGSVAAGGGVAD